MDIEPLRTKNRKAIVDLAVNVYCPGQVSAEEKAGWVKYLLDGGDIQRLLSSLCETVPQEPEEAVGGAAANESKVEGIGRVRALDDQLEFRAGDRKKLLVKVENNTAENWETRPDYPLFASYHIYDANGETYRFDGLRTELPNIIPPGGSLECELDVMCPAEQGNYLVMATLVHEGKFWLEDEGLVTSSIALSINENFRRTMTRHARDINDRLRSAMLREAS